MSCAQTIADCLKALTQCLWIVLLHACVCTARPKTAFVPPLSHPPAMWDRHLSLESLLMRPGVSKQFIGKIVSAPLRQTGG
jgi:hypothetical protein